MYHYQIFYNHYGDRSSVYGWEIDHITPSSKNGYDTLNNKQALQWANNVDKSDKLISQLPLPPFRS